MAAEGMRADPDDIVVTTGGQQVIDLVTKTLVDPGDVVICEAPTYPGAVPTFSSYEADVIQIEMDSDGMRVDLLEETLEMLDQDGRKPKFVYTVPTFQNPAGVTLSAPRRSDWSRSPGSASCWCSRTTRTGCCATRVSPYRRCTRSTAASTSSTSAPSPRYCRPGSGLAGYARPPRCCRRSSSASRPRTSVHPRSLNFRRRVFRRGSLAPLRLGLCAIYRQRRDAMLDALAEFFPREAEWTQPSGGLFIWATLPEFIDTGDLLAKALREERVAFVPGSAAYVDSRGGSSMRLNFSGADVNDIVEGVRRIGKVVDEQMALFSTFVKKQRRFRKRNRRFPAGRVVAGTTSRRAHGCVVELPRRRERAARAAGS